MDQNQISSTIDKLPISGAEKQLCLTTLQENNYSPSSLLDVLKYLSSIARLSQAQAENLKNDVHFYDQILSLLHPSPTLLK